MGAKGGLLEFQINFIYLSMVITTFHVYLFIYSWKIGKTVNELLLYLYSLVFIHLLLFKVDRSETELLLLLHTPYINYKQLGIFSTYNFFSFP